MDRTKLSWQMRDFAASDPRSFKAALDGRGDGRSEAYDRYRKKALERDPNVSVEALAEAYPAYVRLAEQNRGWWWRGMLDQTFGTREERGNELPEMGGRASSTLNDGGFEEGITHLCGGILIAAIFWIMWYCLS